MTAPVTWPLVTETAAAAEIEARADKSIKGHDGPLNFIGNDPAKGMLNGKLFATVDNLSGVLCRAEHVLSTNAIGGTHGFEVGIGLESARVARHVAQKLATIHINSLETTQ